MCHLQHKLPTMTNITNLEQQSDANNYLHLTNDSYITANETDIPQHNRRIVLSSSSSSSFEGFVLSK